MRQASLEEHAFVRQKEGKWNVINRLGAWRLIGPRLFDDHIDRIVAVAIKVLKERDPQFDLEPRQRFGAVLHGKILQHSQDLRGGLAETLALLGNYPEDLTSCSRGKAEYAASRAVAEILNEADWDIWASLNDLLPLLGEASPKAFLSAVEGMLSKNPSPLDGLFAQEGAGIAGRNYLTGLLWALETLAWDEQYLIRVVVILGEMALGDPGGNWSNRPANSLAMILLPWFPQTLANIEKRTASVKILQSEFPEVAWRLLLALLPNSRQFSSSTRKPIWRRIVPEDWKEGVAPRDYWRQVEGYAELAISAAKIDLEKLASLVDRINDLPASTRSALYEALQSDLVLASSDDQRLPIWNELREVISRHRKYSGAEWSMPSEEADRLAMIADQLAPRSANYLNRYLFTKHETRLFEHDGDYEKQRSLLEERRARAVEEVDAEGGLAAVVSFASDVEAPWQVGVSYARTAPRSIDDQVVPSLLDSESRPVVQFAGAFVAGRFQANGWDWVDGIDFGNWTDWQKVSLLIHLPFNQETWTRSEKMLGPNVNSYWLRTYANAYEAKEGCAFAIDRLLALDRINAAIGILEKLYYWNEEIDIDLVLRALESLARSPDESRHADVHTVVELIKLVQNTPITKQTRLGQIEWSFLPLLDGHHGATPRTLERRLAEDPAFFCEVVKSIFRKKHANGSTMEPTEIEQSIGTNAYRLLDGWKTPPGSQPEGGFNGETLSEWLSKMESCVDQERLEFAVRRVGAVLYYSPPDPDGLWIHRCVADRLNAKDSKVLRSGFEMGILGSRGVHFVDPTGVAERELAVNYRKQADEVEVAGYFRLADTLRNVATHYEREADDNISRYREIP